ncbi:MAG TPA: hypothetical protein VD758_15455 [Gemmatimonadaceae bacterium]|nr:hypothetical protein [Gemmatimonadaceae bacterium]
MSSSTTYVLPLLGCLACVQGHVHALDAATGREAWRSISPISPLPKATSRVTIFRLR